MGIDRIAQSNLGQFTGTSQWYQTIVKNVVCTDGCKFLIDNGAAWLVDAVASHQTNPKLKTQGLQEFQLWEMKLDGKGGCVLTCRADSDQPAVVKQAIPFTDCPIDIKLYVEGDGRRLCILLPSEH